MGVALWRQFRSCHASRPALRRLVHSIAFPRLPISRELQWPRPVRPGDVLTVESEVLELKPSRSRPERGMITVKSVTSNQKGEVVQILTSRMLVWRRP